MVLKHPVVFVTIPLALALGLIWFRRKKCLCDSGGVKKVSSKSQLAANSSDSEPAGVISEKRVDLKHSISLPIGNTPQKHSISPLNNNDTFDFKFGKSAPIDITPHKTSPTRKSDPPAENENKLNSIEESSCDSVDLPGSVTCRRRFSFTIKTNEPAIVVKASEMIVNKSPQSSFETSPPSSAPKPETITVKNLKSAEKKPKSEKTTNANGSEKNEKPSRALPVASPPLSLCSNKSAQSHESGDSGKGSSPPNSEGGQTLSSIQTYDFELQQNLVGYLFGKHSTYIQKIQEDCNVNIFVKRHPTKHKKFKLVTLQGTQKQIDDALAMIKTKMPARANLSRVDLELECSAEMMAAVSNIDISLLQLNLVDGINNDVTVSTVVNGGHLFLQQPLHPTYPSLNVLQNCMNQSYSSFESPALPNYNLGTVCVGHIDGHWYRLQIVEHQPEDNVCLAKYLDFGGYCQIQSTELRQIRTDFMTVPFQSIECLLADIKPKDGEWTPEASLAICELTQYKTLQAQIISYSDAGLPEIHLYSYLAPNNIVFINKELVARNFAEWCDHVTEV